MTKYDPIEYLPFEANVYFIAHSQIMIATHLLIMYSILQISFHHPQKSSHRIHLTIDATSISVAL